MKTEPMYRHSVTCMVKSPFQATRIVDRLKTANFPAQSISALLTDPSTGWPFLQEKNGRTSEGVIAGASTGAIIGGTWGWIAGIGALTIPGVGLFLAVGPVICAMSGVAIGAAMGGVCGGLIGMGIPAIEAKRYEGEIMKGEILLSVPTGSYGDTYRAKDIFDDSRAEHVWASDNHRHDQLEDSTV